MIKKFIILPRWHEDLGCKIASRDECLNADIILCVKIPQIEDLEKLKENSTLIGILNPYENQKYFEILKKRKISACCMELIPRISRAQSTNTWARPNVATVKISLGLRENRRITKNSELTPRTAAPTSPIAKAARYGKFDSTISMTLRTVGRSPSSACAKLSTLFDL